jgi:hypothetical protein
MSLSSFSVKRIFLEILILAVFQILIDILEKVVELSTISTQKIPLSVRYFSIYSRTCWEDSGDQFSLFFPQAAKSFSLLILRSSGSKDQNNAIFSFSIREKSWLV